MRYFGNVGKLLILFITVILLLSIYAVPVMAIAYYANILVQETAGTDYGIIGLIESMNITFMASQGFINSDGRDVQVESGGTPSKRMLTNKYLLFTDNVTAHQSETFSFSTNNTVQDFAIIPGYGGNITRIDDPVLEWGNNGLFALSTPNFNPTSTGYLFNKPSAVSAKGNGDGTVTLGIQTATTTNYAENLTGANNFVYGSNAVYLTARNAAVGALLANIQIGQMLNAAVYYPYRGAVSFSTAPIPDGATVVGAKIHLRGTGDSSTTDFYITVQSGMPTFPSDPLAAGDYLYTNYSGMSGNLTTVGFNAAGDNILTLNAAGLAQINKTGNTKFILRSNRDIAATAPVGNEYVTISKANTYLEVTYSLIAATVTTAVIPAGGHTFNTYLTGGNLGIQVDSGAPVTLAYAGNITNNANNWTFMSSNIVSSADNITMTTGGTRKLYYAPNTMILGSTLPDREATGGSQDGTFNWGTNPANINIQTGYLQFDESVSTGQNVGTPDSVDVLNSPDNMSHQDSDMKMTYNIFYFMVNWLSGVTDIDVVMIWWWISAALAIGTLVLARRFLNSIWVAGFLSAIVSGAFVAMGMTTGTAGALEFWVPVVIIIATAFVGIWLKTSEAG